MDATKQAQARKDKQGHIIAAFSRSSHGMRGGEVAWGETAIVDGALVGSWAILSKRDRKVIAAGATFPLSLAQNMPQRGTGPAGAIASLDFPEVVRETTFFNHVEIQSQLLGHATPPGSVNPNRNAVPHDGIMRDPTNAWLACVARVSRWPDRLVPTPAGSANRRIGRPDGGTYSPSCVRALESDMISCQVIPCLGCKGVHKACYVTSGPPAADQLYVFTCPVDGNEYMFRSGEATEVEEVPEDAVLAEPDAAHEPP